MAGIRALEKRMTTVEKYGSSINNQAVVINRMAQAIMVLVQQQDQLAQAVNTLLLHTGLATAPAEQANSTPSPQNIIHLPSGRLREAVERPDPAQPVELEGTLKEMFNLPLTVEEEPVDGGAATAE